MVHGFTLEPQGVCTDHGCIGGMGGLGRASQGSLAGWHGAGGGVMEVNKAQGPAGAVRALLSLRAGE